MMDRLSPAQRPSGSAAGYQTWRSLLFLHWPVAPEIMRPLVPAQLSLDLFHGEAYVGLVPFLMQSVRPRWWPARWGFNFLETNVRTYVHYRGRPGVYFFSLDASSRIAVWTARTGWGLPYYYADMQHSREGAVRSYTTRRQGRHPLSHVRIRVGQRLGPSPPGTIEHFLLERYLLFVARRQHIEVGQVHHAPYDAHQAEVLEVEDELIQAAGLPAPGGPPPYAHYAPGVDVAVFSLRACGPDP